MGAEEDGSFRAKLAIARVAPAECRDALDLQHGSLRDRPFGDDVESERKRIGNRPGVFADSQLQPHHAFGARTPCGIDRNVDGLGDDSDFVHRPESICGAPIPVDRDLPDNANG